MCAVLLVKKEYQITTCQTGKYDKAETERKDVLTIRNVMKLLHPSNDYEVNTIKSGTQK